MNYEQANKVKHLAPNVNKVLERLEVECPVCNGTTRETKRKGREVWTDPCYNCMTAGTGKSSYSWTPQVGEWCSTNRYIKPDLCCLIVGIRKDEVRLHNRSFRFKYKNVTPILSWETIEGILKQNKYVIIFEGEYECEIWRAKQEGKLGLYLTNDDILQVIGEGKSRQKAVMKAVIELGKEKKNDLGNS